MFPITKPGKFLTSATITSETSSDIGCGYQHFENNAGVPAVSHKKTIDKDENRLELTQAPKLHKATDMNTHIVEITVECENNNKNNKTFIKSVNNISGKDISCKAEPENDEQQIYVTEVDVTFEKDPIKIEQSDVNEEQEVKHSCYVEIKEETDVIEEKYETRSMRSHEIPVYIENDEMSEDQYEEDQTSGRETRQRRKRKSSSPTKRRNRTSTENERVRRYRENLKKDPIKYLLHLEKEKQRDRKRREMKKKEEALNPLKKLISREKNKNRVRAFRAKLKNLKVP